MTLERKCGPARQRPTPGQGEEKTATIAYFGRQARLESPNLRDNRNRRERSRTHCFLFPVESGRSRNCRRPSLFSAQEGKAPNGDRRSPLESASLSTRRLHITEGTIVPADGSTTPGKSATGCPTKSRSSLRL